MRAGWVAGTARGRALLQRRLGDAAPALARAPGVAAALPVLAASAYGARLPTGGDVGDVQRSVFRTLLWHLRVLAGWLPPGGTQLMRVLAAPFEMANVVDRLARLRGEPVAEPFALGSLAIAWPALSGTLSADELRRVLTRSAWGDPGDDSLVAVQTAMLAAWARLAHDQAPEAAGWADAAAALQRALATDAATPGDAESWVAELDWWRRVEHEAAPLARDPQRHRAVIIGCSALLAADAWRTATALEGAAQGGSPELAEALQWR